MPRSEKSKNLTYNNKYFTFMKSLHKEIIPLIKEHGPLVIAFSIRNFWKKKKKKKEKCHEVWICQLTRFVCRKNGGKGLLSFL